MLDDWSVNGALASIAENVSEITKRGPPAVFPKALRSAEVEEVFSVYSIGKGRFDETTQFINLQVEMFDFSGRWIGLQTGVHVNNTRDPEKLVPLLFEVPPSPRFDRPDIPHLVRKEW